MVNDNLLPSRRMELEREFNEWAKANNATVGVFNMLIWLEHRGMLLTDRKRRILTEMRDEFRRTGWMATAGHLDEVLES